VTLTVQLSGLQLNLPCTVRALELLGRLYRARYVMLSQLEYFIPIPIGGSSSDAIHAVVIKRSFNRCNGNKLSVVGRSERLAVCCCYDYRFHDDDDGNLISP